MLYVKQLLGDEDEKRKLYFDDRFHRTAIDGSYGKRLFDFSW